MQREKKESLLPATVRGSPVDGVERSNFEDETPKRMQIMMSWGTQAKLVLLVIALSNLRVL